MGRGDQSKKAAREAAPRNSKSSDIVVFSILRDSTCAECGEELGKGNFLHLEDERPLCLKHSGRIGRSAAAKEFQEDAIELAVRAHVRHRHTSCDTLLQQGVPRMLARGQVRAETDQILDNWRHPSS